VPSDRWERVQEIFSEAADLSISDRARFLDHACNGDSGLRMEVESLLREDSTAEAYLDTAIRAEAAAMLAEEPLLAGTRLGAYRVIEEIGRGGMGSVYLAERDDDEYHKRVAIKVVKRGMDTDEVLNRFRHERQILAGLEHPFIARLIDGGTTTDGRPFFVMEKVKGEPINVYCVTHKLDVKARLRLFLRVCEAVSHAHRALIVHRDLKPSNILVTPEGVPKLLDFGVAKLLDPEADPGLTATNFSAGPMTPEYASPEQVRGLGVTTATDAYALGAILYELLTGERAQKIDTRSPAEIDRVVCEVQPERPSLLAKGLNTDLDNIVLMAMRKESERRYQSVEQFSADIVRYLSGRPVAARQDSFTYRAGKFIRRNRLVLTAAALVFGSLVAGVVVSIGEARQAEAARRIAEMQRQTADRERTRADQERQRAQTSQHDAEREAANALRQGREAELQRLAAETERQIADRRFQQVRQLAGKFLLEFHDAIAKLPGSTPARKMVVETGLQYYDSLAREASGNRDLLEEIARGYDRLGDVQGNPYAANLGDLKGARASYGKALAIRDRIADSSPAFLRDRIQGKVRVAQVSSAQGDLKGAERNLHEAISLGANSTDYEVRQSVIRAYSSLVDLKSRAVAYNEATDAAEKLLELSEQLAREGRDPSDEERGLSLAHTKLGDTLNRVGRNREALEHLRIAVEIDKRRAAADPNDLQATRKLFITYHMIGRVFRSVTGEKLGSPEEARTMLEAAANLADKMAKADPNNNLALMDVLNAHSGLGDFLRRQNNLDEAIVSYRKAVETADRLNSEGGGRTFSNLDGGMQAHHRLGIALSMSGRTDEALDQFQKASNYWETSEKLTPGANRNLERKAEIEGGRAETFQRQGNWNEAIAAFTRALAGYEEVRRSEPTNESVLLDLPEWYSKLADCYAAAGQPASAAQAARTALDRYQEIEATRPLVEDELTVRSSILAKLANWSK
jgi:tetratricopeptide (TPR) repeat protein